MLQHRQVDMTYEMSSKEDVRQQNIQGMFRGCEQNTALLIKHANLLEELLRLQMSCPADNEVANLTQSYLTSTEQIEGERILNSSGNFLIEVNKHHDARRLILINDTMSKLVVLKSRKISSATQVSMNPDTRSLNLTIQKSSHLKMDHNVSPELHVTNDSVQGTSDNTQNERVSFSRSDSVHGSLPCGDKEVVSNELKCTRSLPLDAVGILKSWYEKHRTAPYPTQEQLAHLINRTGLTVPQIRKWLANKRLRSRNTYKQSGFMNPLRYHSAIRKIQHHTE